MEIWNLNLGTELLEPIPKPEIGTKNPQDRYAKHFLSEGEKHLDVYRYDPKLLFKWFRDSL
jgi:hypothetical protein